MPLMNTTVTLDRARRVVIPKTLREFGEGKYLSAFLAQWLTDCYHEEVESYEHPAWLVTRPSKRTGAAMR
jgi:hypothetical protein